MDLHIFQIPSPSPFPNMKWWFLEYYLLVYMFVFIDVRLTSA
jgi:hypothetical protein